MSRTGADAGVSRNARLAAKRQLGEPRANRPCGDEAHLGPGLEDVKEEVSNAVVVATLVQQDKLDWEMSRQMGGRSSRRGALGRQAERRPLSDLP
jgi:hypothetical protein